MFESTESDLLSKINDHLGTRIRFLADPVGTLEAHGITIPDSLRSELPALVERIMDDYPTVGLLPTGTSRTTIAVSALRGDAGADAGAGDAGTGDAGTGGGTPKPSPPIVII